MPANIASAKRASTRSVSYKQWTTVAFLKQSSVCEITIVFPKRHRSRPSTVRYKWRRPHLFRLEVVRQQLERGGFAVAHEYGYGPNLRKVRFEHKSRLQEVKNRPEKTFRWEHRVAGTWLSGDGGMPTPLYVNDAFREREQIGLVVGFEGEAKADLAGTFGIAAFSFKGLTAEQTRTLADGEVVLWRDNDKAGEQEALRAAQTIQQAGLASIIRVLTPPAELMAAEDIVDAVQNHNWGAAEVFRIRGDGRSPPCRARRCGV